MYSLAPQMQRVLRISVKYIRMFDLLNQNKELITSKDRSPSGTKCLEQLGTELHD